MALQARGPVMDYGFEGKGSRGRRHFYLEGVKRDMSATTPTCAGSSSILYPEGLRRDSPANTALQ